MFRAARIGIFTVVILLSAVNLGFAARMLRWSSKKLNFTTSEDRFILVTSILSILVLLPMMVLGALRKQTMATAAWFELSSLSILWIFWLAIAAHIASSGINHLDCSLFDLVNDVLSMFGEPPIGELKTMCRQEKVLEAFGFINWILLMFYTIAIAAFAFTAISKGVKPWFMQSDDLVSRSYAHRAQIPTPMASPRATGFNEDTKEGITVGGHSLSYSHDV